MKDSSTIDDSFYQNINEYKKIFDVSTLNSENETQYYASGASRDNLNHLNNNNSPKGKYYPLKKNGTEEWNKNISRTISRINQIMSKEDPIEHNPLKHQMDENNFDYKDPLMENKDLFPASGIEINTTENKRNGRRKSKNDKMSNEMSPKKKNNKGRDYKRKSKKNKESKKKDNEETTSPSNRRHSSSSEGKRKHKKGNKNLNDLDTSEVKYDADVSLNSDSSTNKMIQDNINEYSKNKEIKLKRHLDDEEQKKQETSEKSPNSLLLNNLNNTLENLINHTSNNNKNNTGENNNSELNKKILYIEKLINDFKDKDEKQSISPKVPMITTQYNDASKNKNNNEEISIEIRCPFYSIGCNWRNKQCKLSDHLLYECTYCPNIITNSFVSKPSPDKNVNLKKSIENLNDNLANLKLSPNDNKPLMKKKTQSTELDKEVLNFIYNNYLNEDEKIKPEKEKSIRDKQDRLFEQIIQDYNYNSEDNRHDNSKKLILDTLNFGYNNEDLISSADINFNNEPLTWDINSEKDNTVPWSASTSSEKYKERKKYRLSDTNDEVKVKNRKSPVTEMYAGKNLIKKYDRNNNLSPKYKNKNDHIDRSFKTDIDDQKPFTIPLKYDDEEPFDLKKEFKFNSPSLSLSPSTFLSAKSPTLLSSKPTRIDINDITLSINTQLLNNNNDISSIFTPQEIEVLMDIWFKKDNENGNSENNLIFNQNETTFIKQLLSTFDDETKNSLKEFNNKKLKGSSHNLLKSIDNLLALRKNEELDESRYSSIINLNDAFSRDFTFNFNFDKWNQSRENLSITKDLNQAFKIQNEGIRKVYNKDTDCMAFKIQNENTRKVYNKDSNSMDFKIQNENTRKFYNKNTNSMNLNQAFKIQEENTMKAYNKDPHSMEFKKNQLKYMILCWIAKLFRNNTIYTICWKFINILYNWVKYIKNKLVQKTIVTSKMIGNTLNDKYKKYEEEKTKKNINDDGKKENISKSLKSAISKYDSENNLSINWSPNKKYQKVGMLEMKKKRFNKTQAQYYNINQHNSKHNKDKHTLYTNFLDYQTNQGFKSLNIQNNIRKKIKMMQTIKDIKNSKTKSIASTYNKNKKRKVEMEKNQRSSITSYFNNTINLVINSLLKSSNMKPGIVDGDIIKEKMHIFGAEANIDFKKHTLIVYNKKTSELNYIPKNRNKIVKKAVRLNEIDQLIIYNNDESGWMNILTSKPISNNMDLFYYEVKVGISNPSKKCLYSWSIGFSTSKVQLNRYPDRLYSWDYYNTGVINKNNSLEKYGETFTQNDVIGCGIDFKNNLAFYTKNGKFLGVTVSNFLTEDLELYPNIGLFNYAKVETNFGSKEFLFNIKSYFYNKKHYK